MVPHHPRCEGRPERCSRADDNKPSRVFREEIPAFFADLSYARQMIIAPRAQSERSEASVVAVAARGAGYQENGRASSVWTIPGAKLLPF